MERNTCALRQMQCFDPRCRVDTMCLQPAEFAWDVEVHTDGAATIQEPAANILKTQAINRSGLVRVHSSGPHDMKHFNPVARIVDTLRWFSSVLRLACHHLIWIHVSAVSDIPGGPFHANPICRYNRAAEAITSSGSAAAWTTTVDQFETTLS